MIFDGIHRITISYTLPHHPIFTIQPSQCNMFMFMINNSSTEHKKAVTVLPLTIHGIAALLQTADFMLYRFRYMSRMSLLFANVNQHIG